MSRIGEGFVPWDGDYDKVFYDVLLPDGKTIEHCWPNAGKMCETRSPFRQWLPTDRICVRVSKNQGPGHSS